MTVLFDKLPCTELYLESMIPWKYAPKNIIIDRPPLSNKILKNSIATLEQGRKGNKQGNTMMKAVAGISLLQGGKQ